MIRLLTPCLAVACTGGLEVHDKTTPLNGSTDAVATTPDPVDTDVEMTTPANEAPIADAGIDLEAVVPEEVDLDGSASYDPDGDVLNYEWILIEIPTGSGAFLINENRVDSSFYADRAGLYVAELAVDDGEYVATDEVEIVVGVPNEGPIANAGPDRSVDAGDRVVLNGTSSYDPDGDALQYVWSLVTVPTGSAAVLDDPTASMPAFTADVVGTYVIELVVSDGADVSSPDQMRVTGQDPGSSDCLSCATADSELRRRWSAGNAASSLGLVLLPFGVLWLQRKREDDGPPAPDDPTDPQQ